MNAISTIDGIMALAVVLASLQRTPIVSKSSFSVPLNSPVFLTEQKISVPHIPSSQQVSDQLNFSSPCTVYISFPCFILHCVLCFYCVLCSYSASMATIEYNKHLLLLMLIVIYLLYIRYVFFGLPILLLPFSEIHSV